MALRDDAYVIPSRILVYTAPVGTVIADPVTKAGLDTPPNPWALLAHVATEEGDGAPGFTRDGGDVTKKGSMTKRQIRTVIAAVATGMEMDFTQLSRETLALYHGTAGGTTAGRFSVYSSDNGATETAVLVVWEDGTKRVGLTCERGSWSGRDSITTDSVEDAVRVPMSLSFLDPDGVPAPAFEWLSPTLLPLS